MTESILIVGATSAIARALAHKLAATGYDLYLASRDEDELNRISSDLQTRYPIKVAYHVFDIANTQSHDALLDSMKDKFGELSGVVIATGLLGDNLDVRVDDDLAAQVFTINFTAPALLLNGCARILENKGHGFIVGITSVAGDRGRQSNYTYGAAKGGLALYLQGLRNRLYRSKIQVLTVKPGFVDTAMTYGMPGMFLVASPDKVAADIMKALKRGHNVVYTPGFWLGIMWVIRHIPERVFKRLSL